MKNELDSLMEARGVDALLVVGPGFHNPFMTYLTGGGHMTSADVIKKRGETPVLFCRAMERDEAARTGLPTRVIDSYNLEELLKQANGNLVQAAALRYQRMFSDVGLESGRVALYGQMDAGLALSTFSALQARLPGIQLSGEMGSSLLLDTMATKDDQEVERIRRMGKVTTSVIGDIADFLSGQTVKDEMLVKPDGSPLTIGDVKQRINLWLSERGAENPEGTIFAIGRDAGVPHSTGINTDPLRLGRTIVFDIFPREAGGGYFYDITRTWCLGYATDEALALYEDVLAVFQQVRSELKVGQPTHTYQVRTCELFEQRGHPTLRSHPQTTEGYVHSLGHGVGLHIHENPFFRANKQNEQLLQPGNVVTVEPGLYYPERGLGVRLEDTVWARPDGVFETLADFPLDFVLPVKK